MIACLKQTLRVRLLGYGFMEKIDVHFRMEVVRRGDNDVCFHRVAEVCYGNVFPFYKLCFKLVIKFC